jgi:HAD superfamily hydrolase (TIGR01549 family)
MRPLALFDLDDTLVDRRGAFRAWAEEFVAAHGLGDEALAFLLATDADHTGPMGAFFERVHRALRLSPPAAELWAQYRRRLPELASCHGGNVDALRRLRRAGWRIGIVTNGMADNQVGKIRRTGLDRMVDAWCVSDEVGIRKPDAEIFRLAATRCGSDPDRGGWMIGDSLALDVAGGRAAGLRTIWLRGGEGPGSPPAGRPAPEFTVESVAEAVDVLLGSRRTDPHR